MDSLQKEPFLKNPLGTTLGQWVLIAVFIAVSVLAIHKPLAKQPAPPLKIISADLRYATDGTYMYFEDRQLPGADPATFKLVGDNTYYSADKNNAYYQDTAIQGAATSTFVSLSTADSLGSEEYAKDSRAAYYDGKIIQGSDPATFSVLNSDGFFSKDAKQVYGEGSVIEGADSGTFTILDSSYEKDKNAVYVGQFVLEGADPVSFKVIPDHNGNYDARDKYHTYYFGNIVK